MEKEMLKMNEISSYPILYESKAECCGCTACYAICPQDAILMIEDEEGFEYPQLNDNKCVCCYRCIKVCPIKNSKCEITMSRDCVKE